MQNSKSFRDFRSWIAQHRELVVDLLVPNQPRMFDIIRAEGDNADSTRLELLRLLRELAQLVNAERSPVSTIEQQQDGMAEL